MNKLFICVAIMLSLPSHHFRTEKSANETVTAMEKFEQPFPTKDQRVGGFSLSYFEPADVDG